MMSVFSPLQHKSEVGKDERPSTKPALTLKGLVGKTGPTPGASQIPDNNSSFLYLQPCCRQEITCLQDADILIISSLISMTQFDILSGDDKHTKQ